MVNLRDMTPTFSSADLGETASQKSCINHIDRCALGKGAPVSPQLKRGLSTRTVRKLGPCPECVTRSPEGHDLQFSPSLAIHWIFDLEMSHNL